MKGLQKPVLSLSLLDLVLTELREEADKTKQWGRRVLTANLETQMEEVEDLLAELEVSLTVIEAKAQFLRDEFDLIIENLPGEDEDDQSEEGDEEDIVFFSLADAARAFGLSPHTLRNQVAHGRLEAVKIGRNWATTREWMEGYLSSRKKNAKNGVNHSG